MEIPRSSYYYKRAELLSEIELETKIKEVFLENKARFGARKIKRILQTQGIQLSRRRIRRIMKRLNLVCVCQKAAFKPHSKRKNEAPVPNYLERQFDNQKPLEVLGTDLTYVRVGTRWAYVSFIIDLYNQEIIGLSVGWHKNSGLGQTSYSEYSVRLD